MSGRMIAQLLMVGVGVVSKAFMQAYTLAKAGGGAAARTAAQVGRMPSDQAREVLQVAKGVSREEIMAQFARHYEANEPDKCVLRAGRGVLCVVFPLVVAARAVGCGDGGSGATTRLPPDGGSAVAAAAQL